MLYYSDVIFYIYRQSEISLSHYLKALFMIALFMKGLSMINSID